MSESEKKGIGDVCCVCVSMRSVQKCTPVAYSTIYLFYDIFYDNGKKPTRRTKSNSFRYKGHEEKKGTCIRRKEGNMHSKTG